jgi:hypothetical protein
MPGRDCTDFGLSAMMSSGVRRTYTDPVAARDAIGISRFVSLLLISMEMSLVPNAIAHATPVDVLDTTPRSPVREPIESRNGLKPESKADVSASVDESHERLEQLQREHGVG